MNAKSKKFILNKLIPFVTREHGCGFAMSTWKKKLPVGFSAEFDDLEREIPVCGTVACLGGSTQLLRYPKVRAQMSWKAMGKILGISEEQAHGLFFYWKPADRRYGNYAWPKKFAVAFGNAKTPYGKAMVAVRLLKEVVKTEGACLNPKE